MSLSSKRWSDKTFREDLYYRISVIPVQLPALRERTRRHSAAGEPFHRSKSRSDRRAQRHSISDEVMSVMKAYRWPGNVRELQNAD